MQDALEVESNDSDIKVAESSNSSYQLKVWDALVCDLFKLPHDQLEVVLVQLVVFAPFLVELLEPFVILIVHIVRTTNAVFNRRREPDQSRGLCEGTTVKVAVVVDFPAGIWSGNV